MTLSLPSNLTLSFSSALEGHIAIGFSIPILLGIGKVSGSLRAWEMPKGPLHLRASLFNSIVLVHLPTHFFLKFEFKFLFCFIPIKFVSGYSGSNVGSFCFTLLPTLVQTRKACEKFSPKKIPLLAYI